MVQKAISSIYFIFIQAHLTYANIHILGQKNVHLHDVSE